MQFAFTTLIHCSLEAPWISTAAYSRFKTSEFLPALLIYRGVCSQWYPSSSNDKVAIKRKEIGRPVLPPRCGFSTLCFDVFLIVFLNSYPVLFCFLALSLAFICINRKRCSGTMCRYRRISCYGFIHRCRISASLNRTKMKFCLCLPGPFGGRSLKKFA